MASSWVRTVYFIVFVLSLLSLCQSTTFDCHLDKCVRGQMYCVDDRRRCYNCADLPDGCSGDIPRDCDAFCANEKLAAAVISHNLTLESMEVQIQQLQEQNKNHTNIILNLQQQLADSRTEKSFLEEGVANKTNEIRRITSDLKGCEGENDRLKSEVMSQTSLTHYLKVGIVIAVATVCLLLLLLIWTCVKNRNRNKRGCLPFRIEPPSKKEAEPLISEGKHCKPREVKASRREVKVRGVDADGTKPYEKKHEERPLTPEPAQKQERDTLAKDDVDPRNINIRIDVSSKVDISGKIKRKGSDSGVSSSSGDDVSAPHHLQTPQTQHKKSSGAMPEVGCECGYQKGKGVRLCSCTSQIPATNGDNETQTVNVYG